MVQESPRETPNEEAQGAFSFVLPKLWHWLILSLWEQTRGWFPTGSRMTEKVDKRTLRQTSHTQGYGGENAITKNLFSQCIHFTPYYL